MKTKELYRHGKIGRRDVEVALARLKKAEKALGCRLLATDEELLGWKTRERESRSP